VLDGSVRFEHLDGLSNQQIIDELTAVKGIGEWTVHMFLIFCMGRLDVLATGDLGVKTAVRNIYNLPLLPSPSEMQDIAAKNKWQPYASLACWYMWKSLDNEPKL
jgi:DNA-3-methyladenine glycosylase II